MVLKLPSMSAVVIKDVTRQSPSLLKRVNAYLQSVTTNTQFKLYKHCTSIYFFVHIFQSQSKNTQEPLTNQCTVIEAGQGTESVRSCLKEVLASTTGSRVVVAKRQLCQVHRDVRPQNHTDCCFCSMQCFSPACKLLSFQHMIHTNILRIYSLHRHRVLHQVASEFNLCLFILPSWHFCFLPHKLTFCSSELTTRPQGFVCQLDV